MTPFILQKVNELTDGKSLQASIFLKSVFLRSKTLLSQILNLLYHRTENVTTLWPL